MYVVNCHAMTCSFLRSWNILWNNCWRGAQWDLVGIKKMALISTLLNIVSRYPIETYACTSHQKPERSAGSIRGSKLHMRIQIWWWTSSGIYDMERSVCKRNGLTHSCDDIRSIDCMMEAQRFIVAIPKTCLSNTLISSIKLKRYMGQEMWKPTKYLQKWLSGLVPPRPPSSWTVKRLPGMSRRNAYYLSRSWARVSEKTSRRKISKYE